MTIKKQWLLALVFIAIISVCINSIVLSVLTNRYFKDYVIETYDNQLKQMKEYTTKVLKSGNYSVNQMEIELESHLVDPISRIKVYDKSGNLIADVSAINQNYQGNGMMNGMMNGMLNRLQAGRVEEVEHYDILDGNEVIGQINIMKNSSAGGSTAVHLFTTTLVKNSSFSIGIVLIFAIVTGILISRKMSKELIHTAEMAQNMDVGNDTKAVLSNVAEIRIIQQSLAEAKTKLRLKQKSRKTLIDEMIHQSRTPLTILKTHLEGIEDGVIEMTPEEVKTCEDQIENVTAIINNMSNMIDAGSKEDKLNLEEFDLSSILRQITGGLKLQFDKKQIELKLVEGHKTKVFTDRYKLSQVIYNILTNAYKFTPTKGHVEIFYQEKDENIELIIKDDGQGISKGDLDKIFEAYYRGTGTADKSGEGIGLYIVSENIKSMNGTLRVESELSKGSKFVITIPRILDSK